MKILIVEDDLELRETLNDVDFFDDHETILACNGMQALEFIKTYTPDLILLDIEMPIMDGISVLKIIKSDPQLHHIPVIMISGLIDSEKILECIELGADDYLIKPFNSIMLKARIKAGLKNREWHEKEIEYLRQIKDYNQNLEDKVKEQITEITAAQSGLIFAMAKLAESRDPETGRHLIRIQEYCRIISQQLSHESQYSDTIDDDYINNICDAAPLHDIGKIAIPDKILQKLGKLNKDEYEVMKMHAELGADTLRQVYQQHKSNKLLKLGIEIAENHHEHWDGTGYPVGLKEEQIPLSARILALADEYDAITSKRVYKDAESHIVAKKYIVKDEGHHFDPEIVAAFLKVENEFKSVLQKYKNSALGVDKL